MACMNRNIGEQIGSSVGKVLDLDVLKMIWGGGGF